jgi:tetratricopeptide (TPR) repeat protein
VLALLLSALALTGQAEAPISDGDLAKRFADFSSPDAKVRMAAASYIAGQPLAASDVLIRRLDRPRTTSPDLFRRLFLEIWGQVPNWRGGDPMWVRKPEPPWTPPPRVKGQPRAQRPKPHDPETLDWLAALNDLDLANPAISSTDSLDAWTRPPDWKPPKVKAKPVVAVDPAAPVEPPPPPPTPPTQDQLVTARAEAMEAVALLRGIAASKRMDAVDPMFKLAFDYEGVFRDECGRQIRSMESFAVPALIGLMHSHGKGLGKQRRYASYQLDRMDRARPSKAISAAPDDRVKAAIIHAYGEEKALEAVEAILNQVDAPSHRVRKEARWAWLRYVTGRPPPPAPKRKRKLPGGREEEEEKPDYLTYREIALLALQKQVQEINNEPPDPKAGVKTLTDQLFDYYDRKHAAEWDQQFDAALAKEAAGDWKGATDEYGWILAHDPNYAKRAQMAKAFASYADQLRQKKELSQAVGLYRQAVDLDPAGPEAKHAEALVALLDGQEALSRGQADLPSFRRALALDPSLTEARDGLARAESLAGRRRWLEGAEAVGAVFALLFGLWALWKRVQRPVVPPPSTA